jgi:hypothetical protein
LSNKTKSCLIIPDLHIPFQDQKFLKLIKIMIKRIKPEYLVQLGDLVDFFQISRFSRDLEERSTCYEDLMEARSVIDEWEKAMSEGSEIHLLCGNHEARLLKYYSKRAPDLHGLVKSIPDVYGLDVRNKYGKCKYHWHEINKWDSCKIGDIVFHHGAFFNIHTAVNNLAKYPCAKFVQAHTHRLQYCFAGERFCATIGHGVDLSQIDYLTTPMSWSEALGLASFTEGIGALEILPVNNGCLLFRGENIKV